MLLQVVRPDLYRANCFHVTELDVSATDQEANRQLEKARMMARFGGGGSMRRGPLPLNPPPSEDEFRQARQRMSDPRQRLLDELCWFWSGSDTGANPDPPLAPLTQWDVPGALRAWGELQSQPQRGGFARHNIAVLSHLVALEWELLAHAKRKPLGRKEGQQRQQAWEQAIHCWSVVSEDDGLWTAFAQRVEARRDARLKPQDVHELRSQWPWVLLVLLAQLALRSAEQGNAEDVRRYVTLMDGVKAKDTARQQTLRWVVEPTRDRIATLCQTIPPKVEADPEHGDDHADALLDQARPLLRVIDLLLDSGDALRDGVHDEVALNALECQIQFGNRTENWTRSLELLEQLPAIAASSSARERIEQNLRIVKENKEAGNDWRGEGYEDLPDEVIRELDDIRTLARDKRWEPAIERLEELLREWKRSLDASERALLQRPLAVCLNGRAVERLNSAATRANQPLSILSRINPMGLLGGRLGFHQCSVMGCFSGVLSQWVELTISGVTIILCPEHGNQVRREQESRKNELTSALKTAAKELRRAKKMSPDNKDIDTNLATVEKLAKDLNVNIADCFIATAAYGTALTDEVQILRDFRDHVLNRCWLGRLFVRGYYRWSPPLAERLARSHNGRALVRSLLRPVIALCQRWGSAPSDR